MEMSNLAAVAVGANATMRSTHAHKNRGVMRHQSFRNGFRTIQGERARYCASLFPPSADHSEASAVVARAVKNAPGAMPQAQMPRLGPDSLGRKLRPANNDDTTYAGRYEYDSVATIGTDTLR